MVKDIIESLQVEVTAIESRTSEVVDQKNELEKALVQTENELLRLEGRLLEAQAIIRFLEHKLEAEEVDEEESIEQEEPVEEE